MQKRLVPIDLLFATSDTKSAPDSKDRNFVSASNCSTPVPLVALRPQMDMIRFILKGQGSFDSYWQWNAGVCCGKAINRDSFLEDSRRRIKWLRWSLSFQRPVVSAISRDRLLVNDGVETCCLSKFLGKRWIRVRMPRDTWTIWDSRPTDRLLAVIKRTRRRRFYNPIVHENFRRAKISRLDSVRLDRIRTVLGPLGQGLRGLDIGCNIGYMCHHLERQGFEMTGVDFDEQHLVIAQALNDTYGLNTRFVQCRFNEFDLGQDYDIVLALSVLYHMFFGQENKEPSYIARKIGKLARSALFWESGDQPEKEKRIILSHSGLTIYLSLGRTEGTGLQRELGIFLRPNTELTNILLAHYEKYFVDTVW